MIFYGITSVKIFCMMELIVMLNDKHRSLKDTEKYFCILSAGVYIHLMNDFFLFSAFGQNNKSGHNIS